MNSQWLETTLRLNFVKILDKNTGHAHDFMDMLSKVQAAKLRVMMLANTWYPNTHEMRQEDWKFGASRSCVGRLEGNVLGTCVLCCALVNLSFIEGGSCFKTENSSYFQLICKHFHNKREWYSKTVPKGYYHKSLAIFLIKTIKTSWT